MDTFYDNQDLNIMNFADRVNEENGAVDFTYFAYTANFADYVSTCQKQGGEIINQVCSFENKTITPRNLAPQSVGNLKMVSWNVGNVALTCQSYSFKICYHSTQRRATKRLMAVEQQGKPAICHAARNVEW